MDKTIKTVEAKRWKVVYTKPRSEKKIAERLGDQGFEVYCPLQTTLKQWSDRKKKVSVPIFTSYVFLHISELDTDTVLQDPSIVNFVYWLGKAAIVRDDEIESIRAFLADNVDKSLELYNYEPGTDVDIVTGPFKGQQGTIDNVKGGQISLLVESLGMIIKVAINANKIIAR